MHKYYYLVFIILVVKINYSLSMTIKTKTLVLSTSHWFFVTLLVILKPPFTIPFQIIIQIISGCKKSVEMCTLECYLLDWIYWMQTKDVCVVAVYLQWFYLNSKCSSKIYHMIIRTLSILCRILIKYRNA